MALFQYRAIDRDGRSISGQMDAETRDAVLRQLTEAGHYPIDATEEMASGASSRTLASTWRGRPRRSEVTLFTRELSMLLKAGLTLSKSLSLLEQEASAPRLQRLSLRLRNAIASGKSFHEALEPEGETFPPVYKGMIKAAEATGTLDTVLERIAEQREREEKLNAKILSALLYPSLLIATAIGAVLLLLILVVPRFKEMVADQSGKVPASAAAVIGASDWLNAHGELLAIALAIVLLGLLVVARQAWARRLAERALFATPGIGRLMRLALTVRFCRTMGVLLTSGVGLPQALAMTRDVIANEGARDLIQTLIATLRQGGDFAEPIARSGLFPPLVASILKVGGETGSLAASSLHLAEMYESKLEVAMQRLVSVLEPLIIILVSLFVAFVVLSIMGAVVGVYDLTTS